MINGENTIFGVATQGDFLKWSDRLGVVFASEEDGQFVQWKDSYYRDDWLRAVGNPSLVVESIRIAEISDLEYEILKKEFDDGSEGVPEEESVEPEPEPAPEPEPDVEQMRAIVTANMAKTCEEAIMYGVTVAMADGEDHHFSLSPLDQINLLSLKGQIDAGEEQVPYHADGEPVRMFTAAEIKAILDAASTYRTWNLMYLDCLKAYIASMTDIQQICSEEYGMTVPDEYLTELYKYYFGR